MSSAYYVHFAHQLQFVVVAVVQKHFGVGDFFDKLVALLNVVGDSCKRKDMVREDFEKKIEERTKKGKIKTTKKGLNQEVLFQRHDKLVLTIKNCGGWLVFFFISLEYFIILKAMMVSKDDMLMVFSTISTPLSLCSTNN